MADFGMKDLDRLMTFQRVAHATGRRLGILPRRDAMLVRRGRRRRAIPRSTSKTPTLRCTSSAGQRHLREDRLPPGLDLVHAPALCRRRPDVDASDRRDAIQDLAHGACPAYRPRSRCRGTPGRLPALATGTFRSCGWTLQPAARSLRVHSSAEAFNEEMSRSQDRLARWLQLMNMDSVHIHASGHAPQQDLPRTEQLSPKRVFPIHTEHGELYAERFGDLGYQTSEWRLSTSTC